MLRTLAVLARTAALAATVDGAAIDRIQVQRESVFESVSYTHLTLPTN